MSLPPSDAQHVCDSDLPLGGTAELLLIIAAQREVIAALTACVAALERQLGLNSSNSGKPPSSDGLKKTPPRTPSLRGKSGKKTGGQKGHPGKTLCCIDEPDETIDHFPATCGGCGGALEQVDAVCFTARQVFDLPEPPPLVVTEHRAHACVCARCGEQTKVSFPEGVTAPVQYGTRIGAWVLYLLHDQFLPEKRLATLMNDLFGVNIAAAPLRGSARRPPRGSRALPTPCAIRWSRRRSSIWTKPAFAPAAKRNGCTSPARCC